jgi:hypothetical protein
MEIQTTLPTLPTLMETTLMEPIRLEPVVQSQSAGLSNRLTQLNADGRTLIDDSSVSESTLTSAMEQIVEYARARVATIGGTVQHKKKLSLYECQLAFHQFGGPSPNEANKSVYMKPDGGILFAVINGQEIPMLIVEDKVQGTNDQLFEKNKPRQSTGNAIERAAKNIRGAEMIFAGRNIFPYVLFASGCDLHHTETISRRIDMMNMGITNHYVEVTPDKTQDELMDEVITIVPAIKINNICGKSIASVFVKAHKWDAMKHGSSMWRKEEIVTICTRVIDIVMDEIKQTHNL